MKSLAMRHSVLAVEADNPRAPRPSGLGSAPLNSRTLFAGGNEVAITHGDEVYRLRLTRQNRLILTK